jgi:hypothetical protein
MEKIYQAPTVGVVYLQTENSILDSSVNGARANYSYIADGWED